MALNHAQGNHAVAVLRAQRLLESTLHPPPPKNRRRRLVGILLALGGFPERAAVADAFPAAPTPSTPPTRPASARKARKFQADWIDLLDPSLSPPLPDAVLPPGRISPPRSGAVSFATSGVFPVTSPAARAALVENKGMDGSARKTISLPATARAASAHFVFGGYAEEKADDSSPIPNRYVVNDMWKFLPYDGPAAPWGWTKVEPRESSVPGPRLASAMAAFFPATEAVGDNDGVGGSDASPRAVILGGWDPQEPGTGGVILEDVNFFDVNSLRWTEPINGNTAAAIPGGPTSRHVAVTLTVKTDESQSRRDVVVLHNHRCDDHVLILKMEERSDGMSAEWCKQPTKGRAPSSRGLHCAAALEGGDPAMVIFGGAAQDGVMSNEAFLLDASTWTWKEILCQGEGDGESGANFPSPRAGACLCPLGEDTVLLFGGAEPSEDGLVGRSDVWVLRINREEATGVWQKLLGDNGNDGNRHPPGRNAATLDRIDARECFPSEILDSVEKNIDDAAYFLLQGGWYPFRETYNDIFVLRVTSSEDQ